VDFTPSKDRKKKRKMEVMYAKMFYYVLIIGSVLALMLIDYVEK